MKLLLYHFVTIYCAIKYLLGIPTGLKKKLPYPLYLLIQACLVIASIIIMLCLSFAFLLIQIFLFGLDLWLILKLGNNYGGRLPGQDAVFESTEEKISIATLVILNQKEDDEDFNKRIQELFKNIHNSSKKLSYVVESCLGYSYYVKNQVNSDDCCVFTKINDKECLTRDEILEHIKKKSLRNMCNGKRLWYGEIFTQRVLWNEKEQQKVIIIVFRHCLGDGPSLLGIAKKFATPDVQPKPTKLDPKYTTKPIFTLDDAYVYRNFLTFERDGQKFETINNERHMAFYIERCIKYVPLIKKIKNKLGLGFTEVLIAGLIASIEKVLDKRDKELSTGTVAVVFRPIDENLVSIINGTYDYNDIANNSTIIAINVPLTMQKKSTMMDRIKFLREEINKAKYSIDGMAFYSVYNIVHMMPAFILKYLVTTIMNVTSTITNVVGFRAGKLAGFKVEANIPFVPQFYTSRFLLTIFTYDDRFHLTLATKEGVMHSGEEVQEVLDNIFTNIDKLSHELDLELN
ncbi:uncharacterized protein [Onthophagus taurus]|uniref:uncharacterized protein isoform X1 n=1 Tax=Onthophagus taurus TaxID=166361 RepID=UPI0039BDC353